MVAGPGCVYQDDHPLTDDAQDELSEIETIHDEVFVISAEQTGRLDKLLAGQIEPLSRSRIQTLIEAGHVSVDGDLVRDRSAAVRAGQTVRLAVPRAKPAEPEPQAIPLLIVYEDEDILVLNKQAGLVVHPGAGNPDGTLVNALLAHFAGKKPGENGLSGIGGVLRPGIVHRLDKDTSGLMVVAKNDRAHQNLTEQFADRSLSRTYLAIVKGRPNPTSGRVETLIGRHPRHRQKMSVVSRNGKSAVTDYRTHKSFAGREGGVKASIVECTLKTGRTHQIRVHMTHLGCPILGDPIYGRNTASMMKDIEFQGLERQALHACALKLRHPSTDEAMAFECSLPSDFRSLADHLQEIGCDNS